VDSQFREARSQILAGKYEAASKTLRKLDARTDIAQPLQNWVTFYAGLAELFAGREPEARVLFAKLEDRGPFSNDPGDRKLAAFFVEVGGTLRKEGPVSSTIARNYDKFNHEAVALLAYALKNESIGNLDEALTFYRQFTTSQSKSSEPFIGFNNQLAKYRDFAMNILENQDQFESANKALTAVNKARTPLEKKSALDEAKLARSKITGTGKLTASLDTAIAELEPQVVALVTEQTRMVAEDEEFDAKALPEAKAKRAALMAQAKFAEAKEAIMEPTLRTEKGRTEQDMLARKSAYLDNFKYNLIQDLPKGYSQPIKFKNGATAAAVAKLDADAIHIRDGSVVKPVPWSEVSPESIFAMAKSLLAPDAPAEFLTFRKWHLGVFAAYIGKTEEARALMAEAAASNPVYEPEIPLILEGGL